VLGAAKSLSKQMKRASVFILTEEEAPRRVKKRLLEEEKASTEGVDVISSRYFRYSGRGGRFPLRFLGGGILPEGGKRTKTLSGLPLPIVLLLSTRENASTK